MPDFVQYVGIITANPIVQQLMRASGVRNRRCATASCGAKLSGTMRVGRGGLVTATIYKICDRELWREAERLGSFAARRSTRRTASSISRPPARWPRRRPGTLPARTIWCWSRSRPAALGTGVEMGAVARRRIVSASLWRRCRSTRWSGPSRCRSAATAGTCFRSDAVIGLLEAWTPAAAASARSGRRASAGHPGAEDPALRPTRAERPAAGGAGVRAEFPESDRHGGGLRQARRGTGRAAAAGLRLCRDRHRHAAAADRQSAAARLPPAGRRGGHQPLGLQQRRRGGGAAAAGRARQSRRHRRRQCRRQQGGRRSHRRLRPA